MNSNSEVRAAIYRRRKLKVMDWYTGKYLTVLTLEHDRYSHWRVLYMDAANRFGRLVSHRKYISIDENAEYETDEEDEEWTDQRKSTRSIEDDWQPSW